MKANEIIEQCNELLEDKTYFLQTIELTKEEVKVLTNEIERLNNIIDKAIEYLQNSDNREKRGFAPYWYAVNADKVLNILQGK